MADVSPLPIDPVVVEMSLFSVQIVKSTRGQHQEPAAESRVKLAQRAEPNVCSFLRAADERLGNAGLEGKLLAIQGPKQRRRRRRHSCAGHEAKAEGAASVQSIFAGYDFDKSSKIQMLTSVKLQYLRNAYSTLFPDYSF